MDYKYIEQLLERYWQCATTLEEENILKAFFKQEHVPAHLMPYKKLFDDIKACSEVGLGADFDAKMLARVEKDEPVKAQRLSWSRRMMPLYKAAAVVAIVLTLGNAAQSSFRVESTEVGGYNYESYQDSYTDPEMAYHQVSNALQMVSQGLVGTLGQDSIAAGKSGDTQIEQ